MIYYIVIPQKGAAVTAGEACGKAIATHAELGAGPMSTINEVLCCMIAEDVTALKKINFTDKDEVRLSLRNPVTNYYAGHSKPSHFDLANIDNTYAIYAYLLEQKVKVNSLVAYI